MKGNTVGEEQEAHKAEAETNTGFNQSGNWIMGREDWLGEAVSGGRLREGRPGSGSQLLQRLTTSLPDSLLRGPLNRG